MVGPGRQGFSTIDGNGTPGSNVPDGQTIYAPGQVAIENGGSNKVGNITSGAVGGVNGPLPGNGPAAPAAPTVNPGQIDFAKALAGMLPGAMDNINNAAAGRGPGAEMIKNMMMQSAQDNAQRGAGLIGSAKGINPALAAKMAQDQMMAGNQTAAQNAGNLALKGQEAAMANQGALINTLTGGMNNQANNLLGAGRLATDLDIAHYNGQHATDAAHAAQNSGILGNILQALGVGAVGKLLPGDGDKKDPSGGGSGLPGLESPQSYDTLSDGNASGESYTAPVVDAGGSQTISPDALSSVGDLGLKGPQTASNGVNLKYSPTAKYADGGKVPGKAQVSGDSPKNDTVNAKLSPGEIVIPRSKVDDPEKAHRFLEAVMNKKQKKAGFGGVLDAKRELAELQTRMGALKKHIGKG